MRRPPGPRNRFPFQVFLQVQRNPLGFFERQHLLYPDLYCWTVGREQIWVLSHPTLVQRLLTGHPAHFVKGEALQRSRELLGDGLLTAEGKTHLKARRLLQPAFRKEKVDSYGRIMVAEAERRASGWSPGTLNVHREMMALTLAIVCKTLFGSQVQGEELLISKSLEYILNNFRLILLPFFPLLRRLPVGRFRRLRSEVRVLRETVEKLVAAQTQSPYKEESILSLLEEASIEQKVDQVVTILLAGHETTANLLTFALLLLARNPETQRAWKAELAETLGERSPTVEDYANLHLTRNIVEETLRLYPPAYVVGRRNLKTLEWDGYTIPAGSLLLAPQWVCHRDLRHFSEPERFDPSRWDHNSLEKGVFFPFGGGTRVCIGEGFARLEAVLVLAALGQRFLFRATEVLHPELVAGITLRPKTGVTLRVEEGSLSPVVNPLVC